MIEKRRYARAPIDLPVVFSSKGQGGQGEGIGRDISLGGIFIQTETPASFGAEVTVRVRLQTATEGEREFALPGIVRWTRADGMGVQFGLLGVLETHAITELGKEASG